jgi:hypothetical protein
MSMFAIIALICVIGQTDCDRSNARDVMTLGVEASDLACMRQAQMDEAKVAMLVHLRNDEYVKTLCERRR